MAAALLAVALASSASSIEVSLQRCLIERLKSADPEVQRSAAGWLTLMLPRLAASNVDRLATALESACGPPLEPLPSQAPGTLDPPGASLAFTEVEGCVYVPPDFRGPTIGVHVSESWRPHSVACRPSWKGDVETFLAVLQQAAGVPEGINYLPGWLSARGTPQKHARIAAAIGRLQEQTRLFNLVFDPARMDRSAAPALSQLAASAECGPWLRSCARQALAEVDPDPLTLTAGGARR